jgi:hypothetical protein
MPMRPLHLLHLAPAVIVEGIVHLTAVIGRREGSGDGTVSTVVQRGTHSICSSGSVRKEDSLDPFPLANYRSATVEGMEGRHIEIYGLVMNMYWFSPLESVHRYKRGSRQLSVCILNAWRA